VDKVRVLRWKPDLDGWWKAVTLNGTWWAHDDGHWRLAGGQWSGQVSDGNLSTAQAICESDYIARCSEFLRVAGPGECVVNAQYLLSLVDATCKDTCQAYESTQECETCWVELLRRDATATIGAAGGGKTLFGTAELNSLLDEIKKGGNP